MDKELLDKILAFDLDGPPSDYGFSTRLANENIWTKNFTQKAILEYKKFMYLAATCNTMVSPSEIVDAVWHQHLIFTQSYQDFCSMIGKQIQHVPSTHNINDFEKFQRAEEQTIKFYKSNFGEQPKDIWECKNLCESLNLEKAQFKVRFLPITGVIIFVVLIVPFYYLLEPIYVTISSISFLLGLSGLTITIFVILDRYSSGKLESIANSFSKNSFIYNLQPYELIYLKTQNLSNVINGIVNELIINETIKINSNNTIELSTKREISSIEQFQVVTVLSELKQTFYPIFLKQLGTKPIFSNIVNSMNSFEMYFNNTKKFSIIFYLNFLVLSIPLMLSIVRIVTAILRDKPLTYITWLTVFLIFSIVVYLIDA